MDKIILKISSLALVSFISMQAIAETVTCSYIPDQQYWVHHLGQTRSYIPGFGNIKHPEYGGNGVASNGANMAANGYKSQSDPGYLFPKDSTEIVRDGVIWRRGSLISTTWFKSACILSGYCDEATYMYQVCKVSTNAPPNASNKSLFTNEDASGAVSIIVTDPDAGDTHTYGIASGPSVGSAYISGSTLNYTPPSNWSGTTSLTYAAVDSAGAWSNVATVYITVNPVNDPPVAVANSLTVNEDTAGSVALSVIDPDIGDSHTYYIATAPNNGTASIVGNTLTFNPSPNWSGSTSLTYQVKDSAGAWSGPATVTITVNPINDPPVAAAKSLTTNEDTAGSVTLSATDIDSPVPTVFQVVSSPANGSASISGSTLTFTPAANWSGSTSLTYRAQDTAGAWSAPVTVTITVNSVNDVPVAVAKLITTNEDTAGSVTLSVIDPDIPYGDTHTYQIVQAPANGAALISGSTLTFTPAANWNGATSLTYRAQDSAGAWSPAATVSISVTAVNDAPVAQSKTPVTDEDTVVNVTLTATDIDSPAPTIFQIVAAPNASNGSVVLSGSTATFTPAANWNGIATFTYRAQDLSGAWSAAVAVTVTVNAVNDVPVAAGVGVKLITVESKSVSVSYKVAQ